MIEIDLDNNATTRPSPAVIAAVGRAMSACAHNPSSVHRAGQAARREVELARREVADLIGARPREVVFTSGGTESIDLALRGMLAALPAARRTLATTRVEHAAVRDLAQRMEDEARAAGAASPVVWLDLSPGGVVDAAALESALRARAAAGAPVGVVSVQWANNETGAIQPVGAIGAACRAHGAMFHCDATQWVGKMPTRVVGADAPAGDGDIACDAMTFSPHKFHGPKGVGVLWLRPGVRLSPRLVGTQELGRRGGTENVPGIVGAGEAAVEARAWLADAAGVARGAALRDRLEAGVLSRAGAVLAGVRVNGPTDRRARLWNTSNIAFPRLEAEALLLLLSERGVWASAGAACSSGSLEPSPVLLAMGVPAEAAHGSIRLSLSRETTEAEVDAAVGIIAESVARLARSGV